MKDQIGSAARFATVPCPDSTPKPGYWRNCRRLQHQSRLSWVTPQGYPWLPVRMWKTLLLQRSLRSQIRPSNMRQPQELERCTRHSAKKDVEEVGDSRELHQSLLGSDKNDNFALWSTPSKALWISFFASPLRGFLPPFAVEEPELLRMAKSRIDLERSTPQVTMVTKVVLLDYLCTTILNHCNR